MGDEMRIGMFVHGLNDRGIGRAVRQVSETLVDAGVETSIVCIDRRPEVDVPEGITVVELKPDGAGKLATLAAFARAMRNYRFDAIFAHGDGPSRDAVLARQISRTNTGLIVVSHILPTMHPMRLPWLKKRLVSILYRKADVIAGVSPGVVEDLLRLCPGMGDKAAVLPNPAPIQVDPRSHGKAAHRWLDDDALDVIVMISHFNRRKGHDVALRAFAEVVRVRPNCRLMLIGAPDDEDYKNELLRYVDTQGLSSSVEFVHGVRRAFPYLNAADVFVHAARSEAHGLVVLEALVSGIPIVAADSPGGVSWILDGGRHGDLVPVEDDDAMARAIVAVLETPPDRERLAMLGMQRAEELFSRNAVADNYIRTARRAEREVEVKSHR